MTSLDVDVARLNFVELSGYHMAYREWGNTSATEALVLILGITSSSLSWIRVAPSLLASLAARARVIAVDLKGHGDSDRPATGYRIADQADEVAGLCKALGLQKVSVVGHSWAAASRSSGWTEQDVAGKVDAAMKGSRASVEAAFSESGLKPFLTE